MQNLHSIFTIAGDKNTGKTTCLRALYYLLTKQLPKRGYDFRKIFKYTTLQGHEFTIVLCTYGDTSQEISFNWDEVGKVQDGTPIIIITACRMHYAIYSTHEKKVIDVRNLVNSFYHFNRERMKEIATSVCVNSVSVDNAVFANNEYNDEQKKDSVHAAQVIKDIIDKF